MTGAEFARLFATEIELRNRINARALQRASGQISDAEDMVQAAWIRIMREPSGQIPECYYAVALKGIHAAYVRMWRSRGGGSRCGQVLSLQDPEVDAEAQIRYIEHREETVVTSLAPAY